MGGHKLKKYVADNNLYNRRITNYTAIIANAVWLRVKDRTEIIDSIKALSSDLDILSYYTHKNSGIRITTNYAPMVVAIAGEIIKAVKADREPDFIQFTTNKHAIGMAFLEPALGTRLKK